MITCLRGQETKRFKKGELQQFPSGTELPATKTFVQLATPTSSKSIKGTLYAEFNEKDSYLKFYVYYRNNSDNSPPKESLILEFFAPFKLNASYQNQTILYSDQANGTNYHLNSTGLKLFELDDDFHTFKGDDITQLLTLKTLKLSMFVEKQLIKNRRRERGRTVFKMHYKHFEIYYIKDSVINRLSIDTSTIDDGPLSQAVFALSVLFGSLILLALQIVAVKTLWSNLEAKEHRGMFLVTSVYSLFVPVTYGILVKYVSGGYQIFVVILICFALEAANIFTFVRLCSASGKKDEKDSNGSSFGLVTALSALLSVGWFIFLIFEYTWILRAYVFYSFIVIIDLAIAVFGTKYQVGKLAKASVTVAFRGFFIQMFLYVMYFAFFYGSHLSGPPIFYNYILVDCGILGVFILVSVLLGFVRVKNEEKSGSSDNGKSNPEDESKRVFREVQYQASA